MPRYKLILEYDGAGFVGWQRQENGPSVQAAIEAAVYAFSEANVVVHAAGRTDSGVHALAMPAHFDLPSAYPPDTVRDALNHFLRPALISVLSAEETNDDFHSRFSATARHYLYRIVNRRAPLAIEAGRAWRIANELDAEAMHEAAQALSGKHDFSTFRSIRCQSPSPVKTLTSIGVTRRGERIAIEASAPSFLHHQVRSITGTLVQVGLGRWPAAQVKEALEARDRSACGQVAPPDGLYFVRADYAKA